MPASNVAMNAIKGFGEHAGAFWRGARIWGDKGMSDQFAAYSTIAAGTITAGALYGNDHPVLGTMALAATGGLGYSAAAHGHFGARGLTAAGAARHLARTGADYTQAGYMTAKSVMGDYVKASYKKGKSWGGSRMRSASGLGPRNNHPDVPFSHWTNMTKNVYRGPNDAWAMRRER